MTLPSQLSISQLDYSPVLALNTFDQLANQPWAMLLHSAANGHANSRFDILVADPIATLCYQQGVNAITIAKEPPQTSQQDPFIALDALQAKLLTPLSHYEDWPFLGGALGLFGYDLGRAIETLPQLADNDISLPDMAIGIYDWALLVDHQKQQAILVSPPNKHADRLNWLKLAPATAERQGDFMLTSSWQSNMSKAEYQEKFYRVKDYILAGDCYQINLAQRFKASYQGDEWLAYQQLASNNAAPFSAFIRLANHCVLSVSPERFLKLTARQIETKPIKGTRPRHSHKDQDEANAAALQQSEKDRAENLMIVDLLRNDIGRVAAPGSVQVPTLFAIESFPAVHHLVSTVTGELSASYSATDLLRACFPGGSITGAPKVRAMQIIEELEPHRRNLYCGSIGYISRCGNMDTSITIRTLIAEQQQLYAWAGGGLVMDSDVDAEYQETLDKLNKILPCLAALNGESQD